MILKIENYSLCAIIEGQRMLPEFEWDENFEVFLNQLPTKAAAKLLAMIESIEHYGIQIAIQQQWVKN